MSTIGILALQGDFQAHADMLTRMEATSRLVRKSSDLAGLSGLILPGGESTTFLKLIEEEKLWQPLHRFAEEHPVFGTCAGAILMADKVESPPQPSLSLIRMTVERNAYGRQLSSSIRHAEAARELNVGRKAAPPLEVVLIRAPVITEVGPEVAVLVSMAGQPLAVRQGDYLAATFHPELTADTRIHRYFIRMVDKEETAEAASTGK